MKNIHGLILTKLERVELFRSQIHKLVDGKTGEVASALLDLVRWGYITITPKRSVQRGPKSKIVRITEAGIIAREEYYAGSD